MLQALSREILSTKSLADLNTDAQTMFEFLVLIVDIKYRVKFGKQLEGQGGRGYSLNHDD